MVDAQAAAKTQSEYVKIERQKILDAIMKNRETHHKEWETAHAKWREMQLEKMMECQKALQAKVDTAASGGKIEWPNVFGFQLDEPNSYVRDYDKVICRIDMSADEFIYLSHADFNKFIMDEWHWKAEFTRTSSIYNG